VGGRTYAFPLVRIPNDADEVILLVEYVCPKCGHFNPSARQRKDFQSQQQSSTVQTPSRPQHGASPQSTLQAPNRVDGSPGSVDGTTKMDS
jgi:hypothetical protein